MKRTDAQPCCFLVVFFFHEPMKMLMGVLGMIQIYFAILAALVVVEVTKGKLSKMLLCMDLRLYWECGGQTQSIWAQPATRSWWRRFARPGWKKMNKLSSSIRQIWIWQNTHKL